MLFNTQMKGLSKGSRPASGWQGHNPEAVWLMVFRFDSNTSNDESKEIPPKPFQFKGVYAAKLENSDWSFSGRSKISRRTITASVKRSGVTKMKKIGYIKSRQVIISAAAIQIHSAEAALELHVPQAHNIRGAVRYRYLNNQ